MDLYAKTNLRRWNEVAAIHEKSDFYDVAGFKAGRSTLKSIELAKLGDVRGKSLLHLQCHIGLDTLSWARLGARVTGVDFSDEAIRIARKLSAETGIDAAFVCSDLFDLPEVLEERFDIVFASYGVLCWISDLRRWAEIAALYLKPGGEFLLVDGHPLANVTEYDAEAKRFRIAYSYFGQDGDPVLCSSETSYADKRTKLRNTDTYQWDHSMSDILNALLRAGLSIEEVGEYPAGFYENFEGAMTYDEDGWWTVKEGPQIPLTFSVKATKPR